MRKKAIGAILIFIGIIIAIIAVYFRPYEILSPRGTSNLITKTSTKKEIIGFYPYWNLKDISGVGFSKLTTIYYFAVAVNPDGTFNKSDSGWLNLKSEEFKKLKQLAKQNNLRFGVTIINIDPNSIAQNINNSIRRETLISQTVKLMKEESFQDLNIDLEYTGDSDENLKRYYSQLIADLTARVKKEVPGAKVTLDMLADGITRPRIVDAKTVAQSTDGIIIMGYDFNRLNAISAGPVAPLPEVLTSVNDYLKNVPAEKLILGVPFYGYEWPTLDNQKGSFVIDSVRKPELSTYKRSLRTISETGAIVNFDDVSKSPWFSYFDKDSGTWRQVWFEDEQSLNYKVELIKQLNLAGTAIFALGYEGSFDLLSKLNF